MKYFFKRFLLFSTSVILLSCGEYQSKEDKKGNNPAQTQNSPQNHTKEGTQVQDDTVFIKTISKEILTSLNSKNFETFATYFHPEDGVRFSPYAFIDTVNDVRLRAKTFIEGIKTSKKYTWGFPDGSGDPISLSIPDYIRKFVYNKDFLNAEKTAADKVIRSGNSFNNLETIYPGAHFFESYDPGSHEMAWSSLKFVFKKEAGKFYLVAVVHDQWTI